MENLKKRKKTLKKEERCDILKWKINLTKKVKRIYTGRKKE